MDETAVPKRPERLAAGYSVKAVTRLTGIKEVAIVAFERGEPAGISSEQLALLERAYRIMGELASVRS